MVVGPFESTHTYARKRTQAHTQGRTHAHTHTLSLSRILSHSLSFQSAHKSSGGEGGEGVVDKERERERGERGNKRRSFRRLVFPLLLRRCISGPTESRGSRLRPIFSLSFSFLPTDLATVKIKTVPRTGFLRPKPFCFKFKSPSEAPADTEPLKR